MKKILNEWRRFLREQFLGMSPNVIKIEDTMNDVYSRYDKRHWPIVTEAFLKFLVASPSFEALGAGGSRRAFAFANNDDYVIKIASTPSGSGLFGNTPSEMNRLEADQAMHVKYPNLFPKVYYTSPDHSWFIAQRVNTYSRKTAREDNARIIDDFFPELNPPFGSWWFLSSFIEEWIDLYKEVPDLDAPEPGSSNSSKSPSEVFDPIEKFKEKNKALLAKMLKNKFLNDLFQAAIEFPIGYNDLHLGNVGWVEEGGKKRFVILDYILD